MKKFSYYILIIIGFILNSCSKSDRIAQLNDSLDTCKMKIYFDTTTLSTGKYFFRNFNNDQLIKPFNFNSSNLVNVYMSNYFHYSEFGTNESMRKGDLCYFYIKTNFNFYFSYDKSFTKNCYLYINCNSLDENVINIIYNKSWQTNLFVTFNFKFNENLPISTLAINGVLFNDVYKVNFEQSEGLRSLYFNDEYGILKLDLGEDSLEIIN
jgi:hypothetical protein